MHGKQTPLQKIAVLLLGLLFGACATGVHPRSGENNPFVPKGPRYFGYYCGAGGASYLPAIAAMENCNTVVLKAAPGRPLAEDLTFCRDQGLRAIIEVQDCFFDYKPMGMAYSPLAPDWRTRWARFKESIRGTEGVILAFYFDEPHWTGVPEYDFHEACLAIREDFPAIRVMAILAFVALDPERFDAPISEISSTYLRHVTDTGFDHYETWEKGNYPDLLRRLKAKMAPGQRLWFVPWAFTRDSTPHPQVYLAENLLKLYRLCLDEPACAGLIPFTFATSPYGDWGRGTGNLFESDSPFYEPFLKNLHITVGRALSRGINDELFVASLDFSGIEQGKAGWTYGAWTNPREPAAAPFKGTLAGWADGDGNPRILASYMAPGLGDNGTARVWTAPRPGSVFISSNGLVSKMFPVGGNANVTVYKNGERIWPEEAPWRTAGYGDTEGVSIRTTARLRKGDQIAFVVHGKKNETPLSGAVYWDPVISYDVSGLLPLASGPKDHVNE